MPEAFTAYEASWKRHHPTWEFQLWTDSNRPFLDNEREFLHADTYAAKANVLRYEILNRYGGIYLDTDFECLKNIEPLLEGISAFVAEMKGGFIVNAIIGSIPEHPFAKDLVRCLPGYFLANWNQSGVAKTGLEYMHRLVTTLHSQITVFPSEFFYPYSNTDKHLHRRPFVVEDHPQAYAIHHWEMSWARE